MSYRLDNDPELETLILRKTHQQMKKMLKNNPNAERVTTERYGAAKNTKQVNDLNSKKLDDEELPQLKKVDFSLGKLISQTRTEKKWTRKELAQKINEKPAVLESYETGKAVPNQQILNKLERNLGIKLRGKDIGSPLQSKTKNDKA